MRRVNLDQHRLPRFYPCPSGSAPPGEGPYPQKNSTLKFRAGSGYLGAAAVGVGAIAGSDGPARSRRPRGMGWASEKPMLFMGVKKQFYRKEVKPVEEQVYE